MWEKDSKGPISHFYPDITLKCNFIFPNIFYIFNFPFTSTICTHDLLHNLWGLVQNERISKQWQPSIKLSLGPFQAWGTSQTPVKQIVPIAFTKLPFNSLYSKHHVSNSSEIFLFSLAVSYINIITFYSTNSTNTEHTAPIYQDLG